MVARIAFSKSVQDALHYNEQKVSKGVADLLHASGYLRKWEDLTYAQKLEGLELRNSLNDRATTKTLHVSLNFAPEDKGLDKEALVRIAREYMKGIGFERQPYLVYCHRDAGHPHLHIVSTIIRSDGSRIPTHNLGRDKSSKTRVALEQQYNLTATKGKEQAKTTAVAIEPLKAQYGKEQTRAAIARVVSHVFQQYAFSSFSQYNAALHTFGVVADRGKEKSRTYQHGGLLYRMLDEQGKKIGVPIKASLLPGKPTLKALEQKFLCGEAKNQAAKATLMGKVDGALAESKTFEEFTRALDKTGVFALAHRSKAGSLDSITYVDHKSRCVFNGSDLDKSYSATTLSSRLQKNEQRAETKPETPEKAKPVEPNAKERQQHLQKQLTHKQQEPHPSLHNQSVTFLSPTLHATDTPPPTGLIKKRKRKEKRNLNR